MSIIEGLPFKDYRDDPGINHSILKCFAKSPLLAYKQYFAPCRLPEQEDTAAKLIGRAVHTIVLEGQAEFEKRYIVRPSFYEDQYGSRKDWNGNAKYCREWMEHHGDKGLEVLSVKDNQLVERLALAIEENPDTAAIFESGVPEVTIRQRHKDQAVKGRLDWFDESRGLVADLKTVDDLDNFEAQVKRQRRGDGKHFYYYRQLGWYRSLLVLEQGSKANDYAYVLVAVEKQEPFRCGVYELSTALLDLGETENEEIFADLLASIHSGYWPGNPAGVQRVDLPESEKGVVCG